MTWAIRDGPLENYTGGGGRAKYKKNIRVRQNSWNETKKSCTPINPKKKFMLTPKKYSYKEFDNEKNSCGLKIPHPPPPVTFLMVRP